jgi:hypothetical protein
MLFNASGGPVRTFGPHRKWVAAPSEGFPLVLRRGSVVVALETFGGINVGGEKDGMLVQVSARRRGDQQHEKSKKECGQKNEAMARVRERGMGHHSPRRRCDGKLRAPRGAPKNDSILTQPQQARASTRDL